MTRKNSFTAENTTDTFFVQRTGRWIMDVKKDRRKEWKALPLCTKLWLFEDFTNNFPACPATGPWGVRLRFNYALAVKKNIVILKNVVDGNWAALTYNTRRGEYVYSHKSLSYEELENLLGTGKDSL